MGVRTGSAVAGTVGWRQPGLVVAFNRLWFLVLPAFAILMVLMGDNGLINASLLQWHMIAKPLPLMYNAFGTVVGLVQLSLPFMALSLIGIIRNIDPVLEEAARSLGGSRWATFWSITFPLSMPGVLAGSLLVFAIAISSYVVPALMGGWRVIVMPINIYHQISEHGNWQIVA